MSSSGAALLDGHSPVIGRPLSRCSSRRWSSTSAAAAKMDEALRLASQAPLDAAILDVNVGGAVVFPVAVVLHQRIIFATGYGAGMLPSRFAHRPTLSKPFDYQSLTEALRTVLADQPCHTEAA